VLGREFSNLHCVVTLEAFPTGVTLPVVLLYPAFMARKTLAEPLVFCTPDAPSRRALYGPVVLPAPD